MDVAKGNEQTFYSRNKKELDPEELVDVNDFKNTDKNLTTSSSSYSSLRQRQLNDENNINNEINNYRDLINDKTIINNTTPSTPAINSNSQFRKIVLLIIAVTVHNIPEGLAVGVLFGAASMGMENTSIMGAITLAIGIGIQNFPEGIAVAMPLRRQGVTRFKSFWYGQLSAIVEPVAGVAGALAVMYLQPVLPFALAFAAGAMIFVVVEEVIPETQRDQYTDRSVLGFIGGFLVMMILDVALG